MTGQLQSGTGSSTSSSLIRWAQEQDPEAWQRLVDLYGPLVFYWSRRAGLTSADAADVVQEVFTSVSTALPRSYRRRGNQNFRGWLWAITRNKVRDFYRLRHRDIQAAGGSAAQRQLAELPEQWDDGSLDDRDRSEMRSLYGRAVELVRAEFEDRTWQAFWRSTVEQHATADIAADLGISPNTVRQHKSRVLRRLRSELGDFSG